MLKDEIGESLGEEMYEAHKSGDEMPAAVEFEDDDSSALQLVKQIILDMTSYAANERPNADYIQEFLSATLKKVNHNESMYVITADSFFSPTCSLMFVNVRHFSLLFVTVFLLFVTVGNCFLFIFLNLNRIVYLLTKGDVDLDLC